MRPLSRIWRRTHVPRGRSADCVSTIRAYRRRLAEAPLAPCRRLVGHLAQVLGVGFDRNGWVNLATAARLVAKLDARVLNRTLKHLPRDGSTHWSSRKLAAELGEVSFSAVQRIWRKNGVRPHRLDTHMVSNDPDFETKAADVIGLYLDPPAHAAVFCVDEKTAIQALDRKDRMLPLSPGRAQSHGFEYKRNGTLSLFAALNTSSGEVLGKTAARHTRAVRDLPRRHCGRPVPSSRDSRHLRQRQQPQDAARASVPGQPPSRSYALPRRTRRGSTRSKTGSPASSATSSTKTQSR